jgi:hypothetical protein
VPATNSPIDQLHKQASKQASKQANKQAHLPSCANHMLDVCKHGGMAACACPAVTLLEQPHQEVQEEANPAGLHTAGLTC